MFLFIISISIISAEDVIFNVNMNYQIELENFDPEIDFIDLAGNFNDWQGSAPLLDDDSDGVYTITVTDFEIEFYCEYKFRINANWDTAEFPGGDNRTYTVVEGENILSHWYNDQEPPSGDPAHITFIVDDSNHEVYTGFYLKGSWDLFGNYDPNWNFGAEHTPFYDDGTHGDQTAGDHIWAVMVDLYPDNGVNIWEWGINDQDHSWIDGNFPFQVIDETPQEFTFEISDFINQEVTVIFNVDMSVVDVADFVYLAGSFNDWLSEEIMLEDNDGDQIYTVELIFSQHSPVVHEYKFINGNIWELGIGDRILIIDDSNPTQELETVTFNNWIPEYFTEQDVNVTFQIDLNNLDLLWYNNGVFLRGNVAPLTDNAYDTFLTEVESGIFSTTLLFPAGSYKEPAYVFLRLDNDLTLWYEGLMLWRTFIIDDSGSDQILPMAYWNGITEVEENEISENPNLVLWNYPNPFRKSTTISFSTTEHTENTEIMIYNIKGQKIRSFPNLQINKSPNQQILWDGKNNDGKPVSSGIYFYKMKSGNSALIKKMILME